MKEKISFNQMLEIVCEEFKVPEIALKSKIKLQEVVFARFIFYALAKELRKTSSPQLGQILNQTSPNVIYGVAKVKTDRELNAILVRLIEKIK